MKMKLVNQTLKKTESGNSYTVSFKYQPKDYYEALKLTLNISSDSKETIDSIKDELSIINVGEIFFIGVGKDPQKRIDEFFEPVKELEASDKFEEFKDLVKGLSGQELAPRFYDIKKDIETIEEKKRKSKQDKERLAFLKQCYDHMEESYYIPPMDVDHYSAVEETPIYEKTDENENTEEE